MSTLDDDLKTFLGNVVDARALDNAQKICTDEDIYTLQTLTKLWEADQLKNIFTKGTALSIGEGLQGQSCSVLVTGVLGRARLNEVIFLYVLLRSYASACKANSDVLPTTPATPP